jgi:hypothetical protein
MDELILLFLAFLNMLSDLLFNFLYFDFVRPKPGVSDGIVGRSIIIFVVSFGS